MKQVSGQMSLFDPGMPYGKMSRAHSAPTKERTSASSSKSSAKSKTAMPLFLDLRRGGSGILAEPSWEMGIPWLGECSTRVFGEYPNVAEESGLSQISEENVPQKYFLSARACAGVLRRAEKRGKKLPEILEIALKQQIERWQKYGGPLPPMIASAKCVYPQCARTLSARHDSSPCIDRGQEMIVEKCGVFLPLAGDKAGSVAYVEEGSPTLRAGSPTACVIGVDVYNSTTAGDVAHTIQATAVDSDHIPCVVCYDARGNGDGVVAPTITGDHNNRITDYTVICIGRAAFNSGGNTQFSPSVSESGIAQTVTAKGPGAVCYALQGNVVDRSADCNGRGWKDGESYTLNTVDRQVVYAIGNGQTNQMKLSDEARTLNCMHDQQAVLITLEQAEPVYAVRRLTPLECCRLQGFPDDWAKDIPHSDAQEYRMWGNGMALPNALYILEGIADAFAKEGMG